MPECICTHCNKNIYDMQDPTWLIINGVEVCRVCYIKDKLAQRARKRFKAVA
jgi:hypothetical protein